MPPRTITRRDDILSGRWCLDGTSIAIAAILADHRKNPETLLDLYQSMQLTAHEVEAILAFEFPPIRDVMVHVEHYALTVHCECGEDTHVAERWPENHVDCICGRQWEVEVSARLKGRASGATASVAAR